MCRYASDKHQNNRSCKRCHYRSQPLLSCGRVHGRFSGLERYWRPAFRDGRVGDCRSCSEYFPLFLSCVAQIDGLIPLAVPSEPVLEWHNVGHHFWYTNQCELLEPSRATRHYVGRRPGCYLVIEVNRWLHTGSKCQYIGRSFYYF